jgi:hypothetical protein
LVVGAAGLSSCALLAQLILKVVQSSQPLGDINNHIWSIKSITDLTTSISTTARSSVFLHMLPRQFLTLAAPSSSSVRIPSYLHEVHAQQQKVQATNLAIRLSARPTLNSMLGNQQSFVPQTIEVDVCLFFFFQDPGRAPSVEEKTQH